VLQQARDAAKLRAEVLEMRQKMHDGHPNASGLFDIKHDAGGLVDVEFAVQFLVLAHAAQHPEMTANIGNIALLKRAGELGLIPRRSRWPPPTPTANCAAGNMPSNCRGEHARAEHGGLGQEIQAVKALWTNVFGAMAPPRALPCGKIHPFNLSLYFGSRPLAGSAANSHRLKLCALFADNGVVSI
jgi:glutamate-ammonia-ligase adenylyltransferase